MCALQNANGASVGMEVVQPSLSRVWHVGQKSSIGADGDRQVSEHPPWCAIHARPPACLGTAVGHRWHCWTNFRSLLLLVLLLLLVVVVVVLVLVVLVLVLVVVLVVVVVMMTMLLVVVVVVLMVLLLVVVVVVLLLLLLAASIKSI